LMEEPTAPASSRKMLGSSGILGAPAEVPELMEEPTVEFLHRKYIDLTTKIRRGYATNPKELVGDLIRLSLIQLDIYKVTRGGTRIEIGLLKMMVADSTFRFLEEVLANFLAALNAHREREGQGEVARLASCVDIPRDPEAVLQLKNLYSASCFKRKLECLTESLKRIGCTVQSSFSLIKQFTVALPLVLRMEMVISRLKEGFERKEDQARILDAIAGIA
jgi:hypothetical protein